MKDIAGKRFLTLVEVSKYWNISKSAVYQMIAARELTHYKFGKSIRVKPEHLLEY